MEAGDWGDKSEEQARIAELNEELSLVRQKLTESEEEKHQLNQRVKFLLAELESAQGNQTLILQFFFLINVFFKAMNLTQLQILKRALLR